MRHRPVPGPHGLFNVSNQPHFLADSNAVGWEGAFFTDIDAAQEGTVDHGHTRFCVQNWSVPYRTRDLRPHAPWVTLWPGMVSYRAGDEQRFDWKGGGSRQFLFVDTRRVEEILERAGGPHSLRGGNRANVHSAVAGWIMKALVQDLRDGSPAGPLVGDGLIVALLAQLAGADQGTRQAGGLAPAVLKRVLACMDERLADPLTLSELAALARVSVRHFCRAFRTSTGCSPHQYLLRQRVERAKVLIAGDGMALADIAQAVGFADQSQFTRTFKQHVGMTPTAHRTVR